MNNEIIIRLSCFFGMFILIAVWEWIMPRRSLTTSKAKRWFANLGIVFLNSLAARMLIPVMPIGMALFAEKTG